jgi:hypothetical protein
MPPLRDEVRRVISACYDPMDPHYPRDRRIFSADPVYAIGQIVHAKELGWDSNRVVLSAAFFSHPAGVRLIDLINNVAATEQDVASAIGSARSSFWLTVIANNTLFYLGVCLLTFGVSGLWFGTDWFGVMCAAGGVGATFSALLRSPVRGLQQSIATRIQFELIANGYRKEIAIWKSYAAFSDQQSDPLSIDSLVSSQIRRSAARALGLIEAYCKRFDRNNVRSNSGWDKYLDELTLAWTSEGPAIARSEVAGDIAHDTPLAGVRSGTPEIAGEGPAATSPQQLPQKIPTEKMLDKTPLEQNALPRKLATEKLLTVEKSPLEEIQRPVLPTEATQIGPDEQSAGKLPFILATPHQTPVVGAHPPPGPQP